MRPHRHRGGGRQPGFAMMLLLGQMAHVGFDKIPPVTLSAIAAQVVIFLRLIPDLQRYLPSVRDVCVSANYVWYYQDWKRLFLASFFHLDEWHLYFNMVSLLWKGLKLEKKLGSAYFLYMIAVFSVAVNVVLVGLSLGAEHIFHDYTYVQQCAAGFSGVLFALKVVVNHTSPPGMQRLMGFIPVPTKLACWAELVLIHFLVPNSSFLGHLAGIIVGLIYIKGPLKYIMDLAIPPGPSYTYRQGSTGYRTYDRAHNHEFTTGPRTSYPTRNTDQSYQYTGGMTEQDQMRRATEESLRERYDTPRASPSAPPRDEPPERRRAPPPYPTAPGDEPAAPYPPGLADVPPPSYEQVQSGRASGLYPDLSRLNSHPPADADEVRRHRLARLDPTR